MNVEKTPFGKFTVFLMLFYVAVYMSSPFFPVYQLSILKFDYFTFTMLALASTVTSFITMIFWGNYVDDIGSKNVLVFCGFLIPVVPFLYVFSTNPWILGGIEAFSGVVWAGFGLSTSTYLFDATERKYRTRQLAEYTLCVQVAIFLGAMLGSGILGFFDTTTKFAFTTIFILSAFARLLVVILFYKTLKELRVVEIPVKDRLFKKFITIRPHQGIVYEPAIETVPEAGKFAREQYKEITHDVEIFAKKSRRAPRQESFIKKLEREEDDKDLKEYLRKLKK